MYRPLFTRVAKTAGVTAMVLAALVLQAQAQPAAKTATIFGAKVQYQEAGSGPAVILLHGLGGDSTNWASTIGPLAEKHRVIVPDQIGFGRSDKPPIAYRVATYVDFLDGLYKELKIERASLVGNSLGGWIAAAFTLAYPDKVERLVLVDAAGFSLGGDMDPRIMHGLNTSSRRGLRDLIPLVFYNKEPFLSDASIDAFFARKLAAGDGLTVKMLIESILRGEDVLDNKLSGIKKPTLIIWGRQDGLTPLAMGERFKKEIAGSELLVFDKCGHIPQLEKAAEFNAALIKFLGR